MANPATSGFRDFHNPIWAGQVDLANNEKKLGYGWVHLNQLVQNAHTPRFQESLQIA